MIIKDWQPLSFDCGNERNVYDPWIRPIRSKHSYYFWKYSSTQPSHRSLCPSALTPINNGKSQLRIGFLLLMFPFLTWEQVRLQRASRQRNSSTPDTPSVVDFTEYRAAGGDWCCQAFVSCLPMLNSLWDNVWMQSCTLFFNAFLIGSSI